MAPSLPSGVTDAAGELVFILFKTVIQWGVPAAVAGVVLAGIFGDDDDDKSSKFSKNAVSEFALDDDEDKGGFDLGSFRKRRGANRKAVPELIKFERLNERLESFEFSMKQASDGRAAALRDRRKTRLKRAFGDEVAMHALDNDALARIATEEGKLRRVSERAEKKSCEANVELRLLAISRNDTKAGGSALSFLKSAASRRYELNDVLTEALAMEVDAELLFLEKVGAELPTCDARTRLAALAAAAATQGESLAETFAVASTAQFGARRAWTLRFDGDVQASQVEQLREEVTAVIAAANASRGDEVVLRLNSGGGTVTGYGLAAAQLLRVKTAGLKLTICVEQVAASGGYMMACCADRLVASQFALLGSIGVISSIPNVYERLRKEGIEFNEITAGEFKRTLTPFKKVAQRDVDKSKADVIEIFTLFKGFVATQRPVLDIDSIATGETWFGEDALKRRLCDELKTFDDVLLELYQRGADVISISYREPLAPNAALAGLLPGADASVLKTLAQLALPLVSRLADDQGGLTGTLSGLGKDALNNNGQQQPMLLDANGDAPQNTFRI